jgi:hypothetical protein
LHPAIFFFNFFAPHFLQQEMQIAENQENMQENKLDIFVILKEP